MEIPRLSNDFQEDLHLWAHVMRFPTPIHADIWRDLHHARARILPYCEAWILQCDDGSYVLRPNRRRV